MALLGQLRLLELGQTVNGGSSSVLRALIRDCVVHFRREAILLRSLAPKLGNRRQSLESLSIEHRSLKQQAAQLLKQGGRPRSESDRVANARVGSLVLEFTQRFRAHIQHEERVIHVLARTRLATQQRRRIAAQMLAV